MGTQPLPSWAERIDFKNFQILEATEMCQSGIADRQSGQVETFERRLLFETGQGAVVGKQANNPMGEHSQFEVIDGSRGVTHEEEDRHDSQNRHAGVPKMSDNRRLSRWFR